jgi:hypothetical protein
MNHPVYQTQFSFRKLKKNHKQANIVHYWTKLVQQFHQVGEINSVAPRMGYMTAETGSSIMVHTDI